MTLTLAFLSVITSLLYGLIYTFQSPGWTKAAIKTTPVLCLTLMSLLGGMSTILTAALAAGAVGDAALSRDGPRNFLIGLGAFLIGHLCYIALFVAAGSTANSFGIWPLAAMVVVILTGLAVYLMLYQKFGTLRRPVLLYILVSMALGLSAFTGTNVHQLAVAGAASFIISDILLAFDLFGDIKSRRRRKLTASSLWFLYWGGQCLILLGFSGWAG